MIRLSQTAMPKFPAQRLSSFKPLKGQPKTRQFKQSVRPLGFILPSTAFRLSQTGYTRVR